MSVLICLTRSFTTFRMTMLFGYSGERKIDPPSFPRKTGGISESPQHPLHCGLGVNLNRVKGGERALFGFD